MNIKKLVTTTLVTILLATFFIGLMVYKDKPIIAAASCPSSMDPNSQACVNYLRDQLALLQKQQGTIQSQLNDEQYKQLSLEEKISYINNQISQTENLIKSLEIEIAAHNVEIKLLEEDIQEKVDSISILKQEISVLESTVNQRITESYKYSFLSPFDLFLDSKSFSNILRKTKYLVVTRAQDIASLEDYSQKATALKKEEDELSIQRTDLQTKQDAIVSEKTDLNNQNNTLNSQVIEKNNLLEQSKIKEAQLVTAYQQNMQKLSDLDKAIITWINNHPGNIAQRGWVGTSDAIGRMGNTGCSEGSHLHFGLNSGKKYSGWGYFYSDINLFSNGYIRKGGNSFLYWSADNWYSPLLYSGSTRLPLAGNYILMTQTEHQGNAIDMVSYSQNAWGYKNEGATVYPIMAGELFTGTETVCGGKYAEVHHSNGMVSIYLHLQ